MQSLFGRKYGGYCSLESRNVSLLCLLFHYICINKHILHNYFPSFGPIFFFFNYLLFRLTEAKVTENWLLQAHGLTYLQTLRQCNAKVCHLSIFSSLLIRCMPVSALMTIIHTLSSDNKRNSIICDPWLEHCSLGILKKYFYSFIFTFSVTSQGGIEETFIHSVIHVLIWSLSQSVSQLVNKSVRQASTTSIDFWIISEKGY